MEYFKSIIQVSLDKEMVDKAKKFAEECQKTTDYSDANQFYDHKIVQDHFIGKMGEEATKKAFSYFIGLEKIIGPDYNIYIGKDKSWDDDLYIDGVGLAVKTQRKLASDHYGLSWCFAKDSSRGRRDPVLDNPNAWVCFVLYDDSTDGNYFYIYPPTQIKNLSFKDPKKDYLVGKKDVVYAKDLRHVKENYLV